MKEALRGLFLDKNSGPCYPLIMYKSKRYVEISEADMTDLMEVQMGFAKIELSGTTEIVWQRQVETKSGEKFPYAVRVYSSIAYGTSRGCGEDAIRVVLINLDTGRPIKLQPTKGKAGKRIYRTKSAMPNLRTRCRELFAYVINPGHHCPDCDSLMATRKGGYGEFLGCTNYPDCRGTRKIDV